VTKGRFLASVAALGAVAATAVGVATAAPAEGTGGAPIRIGLISDVGRFNDKSFNQSALEGVRRAQRELGAQIRPIESRAASDYIPNLASCARRSDLCISVGFLIADATNTTSKRFRNVQFAIVDYSVRAAPFTRNRNVTGITFATHENSYLIGCMAALMAQQGRTPAGVVKTSGAAPTISAVGGIKIPTVDIFIAGYQAGAARCVPGTNVLVGYSQDFVAQDKCKEIALDQIAQGSRVVFQVAGGCGLGALDAAREQGAWGIGVDRDQSDLGPHIMTSAVKRVDISTFLVARRLQQDQRLGGFDLTFNLRNSGVAVGKISPQVPQAIRTRVTQLRNQIASGAIKPPRTL
jgi:basic membrane protein A